MLLLRDGYAGLPLPASQTLYRSPGSGSRKSIQRRLAVKACRVAHGRPITLDGHRLPRLYRAPILPNQHHSGKNIPGRCVTTTRKRHAVREMEEGPPRPPCRGRPQTAMSCFGQKPRW